MSGMLRAMSLLTSRRHVWRISTTISTRVHRKNVVLYRRLADASLVFRSVDGLGRGGNGETADQMIIG